MRKILLALILLVPAFAEAQTTKAIATDHLIGLGMNPSLALRVGELISGDIYLNETLSPATNSAVDLGTEALSFEDIYTEKILADNDSTSALDADVTTATTAAPLMSLVGTSATQAHAALVQNVASAQGADFFFLKTRAAAGSTNANTVVSSGDDLGKIRFFAADGAAYGEAAQILVEAAAASGSTDTPGKISFLVSPDGSSTPAEALNITHSKVATFASDVVVTSGDLSLLATGKTIEFETGTAASACAGDSTFNGTTAVTISTTCATTGSRIFLSNTGDGSGSAANDQSGCWATNIQNGVSFDADCSDANMNATFNWIIFHESP